MIDLVPPARTRASSLPRQHTVGAALLAFMVAVIGVATLAPGSPERLEPTDLTCLVCGSAGTADVIRNILLFLPLGVATALLGWRWWRALATGFALSLAVESLQLLVVPGRDPSLSDLLTNSAGTALGFILVATSPWWVAPSAAGGRRLLAGGTVAWCALLAATAVGLQWDVPPLPYQMTELPPPFAGVREYEGAVHERTLDGAAPDDTDGGGALAAAIRDGRVEVGAVVGPMYPPGLLRPVVAFYRPDWSSVLLFGQQRRDLVLRLRTRAEAARLQGPRFVLHDVFPGIDEAYSEAGSTERIVISGRVDGPRVELSAIRDGRRHHATRWRRLSLGWTFVLPGLALFYRLAPLLGALWLAAPLVPLAYWGRRGVAVGGGWRDQVEMAARVAATAVAALLAVSAAGTLAAPSLLEWAAVVAAAGAGWALGSLTSRPS